ncbi:MAG: hypothetical protein IPM42_20540 [Saprospiraceae bacterium]|nr:hypothetical protein [Saprospiraceae bacterium]
MMIFRFLIFFLVFSACSLSSQNIKWSDTNDFINIADKVEILEDPEGIFSIDEVRDSSKDKNFTRSDKVILNFGFTESVHWLRFNFDNTSNEPLILEAAHAFLPAIELYYRDENNVHMHLSAGYQISLNDKISKHHFQIFPLPKGNHEYYIRLISHSHPVPLRIYKSSVYDIKTYRQRLVYGFYLGFMVFVILSNVFFYFSLRNKMYLFYAGIVIVYISYASAVMDGFILYFIPKLDLMFWYVTIPTIGVPLQMIYALVFLEVAKYSPKLFRFTKWLIIYFAIYMVLKFWFPLTYVLAINTVHALISFFVMGYLGYATGKKGNRLGYYFALAYFIYFILVLTEATYIQIGTPGYFVELSHVALATLIEAFLLSFLLSKRFEFEKEETERIKNETQKQLLEKTLENERIVREQNITLEKRVSERTEALNNSLQNLQHTQAKLIQSEKLASLGELTAGIAHEIQNPLNFVNNFSDVSKELLDEMKAEMDNGEMEEAKKIADDVITNLEKINFHGKRADSIVKGMLMHSRTSSGVKELTDINLLADEYLRLAYHGLRAKDKSFNVNIESDFDNSLNKINIVPQDIGRVLLNLITNAFYALNEKKNLNLSEYEPRIKISTKKVMNETNNHGNSNVSTGIEITVSDNGNGVPDNIKEKIFQPFFTTKPTGKGTGLGLSLAYDIVHAHKGEIKLESAEGEGSTFTLFLPY